MKKNKTFIIIAFLLVFILYRLFFCNFIIYTEIYGYEYKRGQPWTYPRGILSPFVKFKLQEKIKEYIKSNYNYVQKKVLPYKLDIDKLEVLSVIDSDNETKVLTVVTNDESAEYVLFLIRDENVFMATSNNLDNEAMFQSGSL